MIQHNYFQLKHQLFLRIYTKYDTGFYFVKISDASMNMIHVKPLYEGKLKPLYEGKWNLYMKGSWNLYMKGSWNLYMKGSWNLYMKGSWNPFMDSCPLYTGFTYMHYPLNGGCIVSWTEKCDIFKKKKCFNYTSLR